MKQHQLNLSHRCESIKNHSHECFTYNHVIVPRQPIIRCNGNCFQRGISISIVIQNVG